MKVFLTYLRGLEIAELKEEEEEEDMSLINL